MGCQGAITPQSCPSPSFSLTYILHHRLPVPRLRLPRSTAENSRACRQARSTCDGMLTVSRCGLYSHGWKRTDKKTDREMARQPRHARAGTAVTASSPLHVWYPFTLPTDPPGAGSAAPEQRGRRQTEGQDRRIRNADSKAMNGPPQHGPHWPPSTDAASPRAHPPGADEPAGSVPNHRH